MTAEETQKHNVDHMLSQK